MMTDTSVDGGAAADSPGAGSGSELNALGSEVGTLVVFSIAMFVGAFGAGYAPLCLSLDPSK